MRFAATLVALAAATAVISHPNILPEFLVQVRDPNLLGGPIYALLLRTFGYALVIALCATLIGGTVILVAWRTRMRGAPDVFAGLAAVLAAFCLFGRMGVSLDPIGWICAAAFALVLERTGRGIAGALVIVALWSLLQGGALLAALLAFIAALGAYIDLGKFDRDVRDKVVLAGITFVIGALQLRALPWHAYGPHLLYLDAFAPGAQRDHLWNGGLSLQAISFCAVVVAAGWYGVRRRGRAQDAIAFFALMLLTLADARNLPYFGIVAAPIVADAAASYYVDTRTFPRGSIRQYAIAFSAVAFVFMAVMTVTEPKAIYWPQAQEEPASLLVSLAKDHRGHRLLCEQPRWCDGAESIFPNVRALLDDRAGMAPARLRRTQADAVATHGRWRSELAQAGVDAVIARNDSNIVALLTSTGWSETNTDGGRVLIRRGSSK